MNRQERRLAMVKEILALDREDAFDMLTIVTLAYRFTFSNSLLLLRVAAVPALAIVAAVLTFTDIPQSSSYEYVLFLETAGIVFLISAFTVAWHRVVLLGRDEALPRMGINLTVREIKYFACTLLLGVAPIMLAIAFAFFISFIITIITFFFGIEFSMRNEFAGVNLLVVMLAILFLPFIVLFIFARFVLVLPAVAIGEPYSFAQTWRQTVELTQVLGGLIVACSLPFFALGVFFNSLLQIFAGSAVYWLIATLSLANMFFLIAVVAVGLSLSYQWIKENPPDRKPVTISAQTQIGHISRVQ